MANTREGRIINPPIRFRNDLDLINFDHASSYLPTNVGSSKLPGSARPVFETIFQSTDLCPSRQMSNLRKRGRHCASCCLFYHLACARLKKAESSSLRTWLYNSVYSIKMPPSHPHSRQQHLLCTNTCRTSSLTPPGAWTTLTSSRI